MYYIYSLSNHTRIFMHSPLVSRFIIELVPIFSSMQKFTLQATLKRHSKPIGAISVSAAGTTLLSGGEHLIIAGEGSSIQVTFLDDDGLIVVWDLRTGNLLQEVHVPFNGPIVTCRWVPIEQGDGEAFTFGCADGSLHVYARTAPEVSRF